MELSFILEIKGIKIELSEQDAKELKNKVNEIFAEKPIVINTKEYIPYDPYRRWISGPWYTNPCVGTWKSTSTVIGLTYTSKIGD